MLLSLTALLLIVSGCEDYYKNELEEEKKAEFLDYTISSEKNDIYEGRAILRFAIHEDKEIVKLTLSKYSTEFELEKYKEIDTVILKKDSFSDTPYYFIKEIGSDELIKLKRR